jgi:DEAD/DEAH box helicase domain-containing protein
VAAQPWDEVLALGLPPNEPRLAHRVLVPARPPQTAAIPDDLHPRLRDALRRRGIERLWSHQARAWELARAGRHVGVVTGTASGKSLAYGLPVLQRLLDDPHARAIYLAPTKALAQDQARGLFALGLGADLRPALYDGDTAPAARSDARRHANLLLTNPDMLHVGICPHHDRWADVLANLAAVIVDEAHVYRGVFGAHVANVLRRLRRACALAGSAPQFLLASATIANPAEAMSTLTGVDVDVIDTDGAPQPAREIALWNPTLLDADLGERASPLAEAATLTAALVLRDQRVICFARSRRAVEVVHRIVRDHLSLTGRDLRDRIAPYRAGYTAEQRRELERRLASGELLAVIATSALELGIDIGLLDCAVVVGFPGTMASLRQRWGRAGRAGSGLSVLVASADALDQYLMANPARLLERPVEAAMLAPDSEELRREHLCCAAFEAPLAPRDDRILGAGAYTEAEALADDGVLARTPAGLAWARPTFPAGEVSLRSSSSEVVAIVETGTGALLGTVEAGRAPSFVHPGAVYLHLGDQYHVRALDLEARLAEVEPFDGDWYTQARIDTTMAVVARRREEPHGTSRLALGTVEVTETTSGFLRRRIRDHAVLDHASLDLPPARFRTEALWLAVDPDLLVEEPDPLGTLHAAEHALIAVLPLLAMCDRWDLGGLSTPFHPDLGGPGIFVYDGHPGGVGIARRGHALFAALARSAHDLIARCPCSDGCPSCVQSPKCGNLNEPLDKWGAARLLEVLADAEAASPAA